jgi:hypothetical protein
VGGSRCVKIASSAAAKMASRQGGWHQGFASPGPGAYRLTYDLKVDNLGTASAASGGSFLSCVHVFRKDNTHGTNLGASHSRVRGGSFGWVRCEVPIDVPVNAKRLTVIFEFQRMLGSVWIDNASLRRCGR